MVKMAQGLQVFDENGNCTLDVTTALPKILGALDINSKNVTGSYVDKRLLLGKSFWFYKISPVYGDIDLSSDEPKEVGGIDIYINGDVIGWEWKKPIAPDSNVSIWYGIF